MNTAFLRSSALRLGLLVGLVPLLNGCTNGKLAGDSSSFLILNDLEAASGAKPSELGGTLSSDVLTLVKQTVDGKEVHVATVFSDGASAKFSLGLKDSGTTASPTKPSPMNFVTITNYHVSFSRTDGRNTQGVDVPYAFDGAMSLTVGDSEVTGSFTIVRIQAKQEAPLKSLVDGGGAYTISTIAEVTFYGTDQAGRNVHVTGRISVNFADWGDPQ